MSVPASSKSLTLWFVLFVLVPSIFYRFGLEKSYPLKLRKLSIYDNAVTFLIPSFVILFFYNGLLLNNISFLRINYRFRTSDLLDLEVLTQSSNIQRFIIWYLFLLAISLVVGFIRGKFLVHDSMRSRKNMKLGETLRDKTWEEVFEIMSKSVTKPEIYVKSKEGDIYQGNLNHYAFDGNKLELIMLSKVKRIIESCQCSEAGDSSVKQKEVDLSRGVLVLPESNIANIWFRLENDKVIDVAGDVTDSNLNQVMSDFLEVPNHAAK